MPMTPAKPRRPRSTPIGLLLSLVGFAVSFGVVSARAGPPPGTPIDNFAVASARDTSGAPVAFPSDTVRAMVQPWADLTLTPGRRVVTAAGTAVTLAHRLKNAGNVASDARLDLGNLAGDGYDLAALALWQDRNGNGAIDAGDLALAPGSVVTLAPGDSLDLLIAATVPLATPSLVDAWLSLTATATGASAMARDTVGAIGAPPPPALAFYTDPTYSTTTVNGAVGQPLHVQAAAPACDQDTSVVDSVTITLRSLRTGDVQSYRAAESAAASGRFRIEPSVPTWLSGSGPAPPGALTIDVNDEIVASLAGCGAAFTEAHLWIDPAGVVFDSRSNAPVSGARVALIDVTGVGNGGQPGGPAQVFQSDGVTPAPNVVLTDGTGRYLFPSVRPSTYRIDVTPPSNYRFPSARPPASLPPARLIDPQGSFGASFASTLNAAPVRFDVPLDVIVNASLYVEKSANVTVAELGDVVDFAVRVQSRSDTALAAVMVADRLPPGFAYVAGTARRDSARIADPAGGAGPALSFALGALGPTEEAVLRYRVRVGPGALDGDGINRAIASAGGVISNTATAHVAVTGGVFADEASVFGTVFVDQDRNRMHSAGDTGVPGVRVVLDDGTFAITDGNGRYSFYGLAPRTHGLRVERGTLPPGARFIALDQRDGGAGTRLVDLTRGDLQHADFALAPDTTVIRMIAARVAAAASVAAEVARGTRGDASWAAEGGVAGDPRSRPASGIVTGETHLPLFADHDAVIAPPDSERARERFALGASPAPIEGGPDRAFEALLRRQTSDVGFIGLANGDTVAADRVTVRVKGETDVAFLLWVNGDAVLPTRVGRRLQLPDGELEAWEYVGVQLRPGENRLEVAQNGACGEEHGRAVIDLVAPDALGRIALSVPSGIPADGHSTATVRVHPVDRRGVAVSSRTFVTLESTLGRFQAVDLDPATPGLQTAVEGGDAHFALVAPTEPGIAVVRVQSGSVSAETTLTFVPDLRPLLAVGVLEGVVSLNGHSRGLDAAIANPGFESPLSQFLSERRDGRASAGARAALFAKGQIHEGMLLTLGYDSDKPEDLRRFRDIQPDAFYPVYGDASTRGYEAQSTGGLYARIDRSDGSLLYGDFVAQTLGGTSRLAGYSRSMTGIAEYFDNGRVRVNAFSSRDRSHRRLDELPGNGSSGPYVLTQVPIVENSERVEIVTRDRDQPSVVLHTEPRARFTDYEIDPFTGRIVFKAPVPSIDAELNPVSVRIQYEVTQGGEPFWASGAEARLRPNSALELGGTYVDDQHPGEASELRGLYAALRFAHGTRLEGEWAHTLKLGGAAGQGGRIELDRDDPKTTLRAYVGMTDSAFSNPSAGLGTGRTEASLHLARRVDAGTQLRAEGLYTADAGGVERRGGLLAVVDHSLSTMLRGELGLRLAADRRLSGPEPPAEFAARGRLQAQWPSHPGLSAFSELEQNFADARRMAAIGGEYRYSAHGRLYIRHELISSLHGPMPLDAGQKQLSTVAGVDADVTGATHAFGEYRVADALAGRDAEAAVGLRNGWQMTDALRLNTTFERVSPLLGSNAGPTTAVTGALDYTADENWKATSRAEIRTSRASDGFLASMAMAGRMNPSWTALGRTLMDFEDMRSQGQHVRDRVQIGFAYRAAAHRWDALGRYELHYDRDPALGLATTQRLAHVVSLHGAGPAGGGFESSLAWAGKLLRVGDQSSMSRSRAQWVHGRLMRDLGTAWDAGLTASTLFGDGATRRDGLGAELGRRMRDGVWFSAGWNYFGYQDPDLPGEEYTQRGAYLRLRARLDDDLLRPRQAEDK